jgi:hypothetical protein
VLHGNKTYLLQDEDGQITEGHSISAGLDYPGIGPEHAWLKESGRVDYTAVTDDEALEGFQLLCRTEGIIPALEPSHAIAAVRRSRRPCRRTASSDESVRPRRQGHLHRGGALGWRCEVQAGCCFGIAFAMSMRLYRCATSYAHHFEPEARWAPRRSLPELRG